VTATHQCEDCCRRDADVSIPLFAQNFGRLGGFLVDRIAVLCSICWALRP
jgi:hypothetical protein